MLSSSLVPFSSSQAPVVVEQLILTVNPYSSDLIDDIIYYTDCVHQSHVADRIASNKEKDMQYGACRLVKRIIAERENNNLKEDTDVSKLMILYLQIKTGYNPNPEKDGKNIQRYCRLLAKKDEDYKGLYDKLRGAYGPIKDIVNAVLKAPEILNWIDRSQVSNLTIEDLGSQSFNDVVNLHTANFKAEESKKRKIRIEANENVKKAFLKQQEFVHNLEISNASKIPDDDDEHHDDHDEAGAQIIILEQPSQSQSTFDLDMNKTKNWFKNSSGSFF